MALPRGKGQGLVRMEITACSLCGSSRASPYLNRRDRFGNEVFTYVKCDVCGLIYLNPRPQPTQILRYYPEEYEAHRSDHSSGMWPKSRQGRAMRILRGVVEEHIRSGVLLDVGCATGEFLVEMRNHGWSVRGIELSPLAAAAARQRYGLEVHTGSVADYGGDTTEYDVITLWDVLEHLYSPLETLAALRRLLAKDSRLVFSVPNLQSYDRHLFGSQWIGWDAPRHLCLFEDSVLVRLMARVGLEIVERRCALGGPGAFLLSLHTWAEARWGRQTRHSRVMHLVDGLVPYLIWPYKTFSYHQLRGPVITYIAKPLGG